MHTSTNVPRPPHHPLASTVARHCARWPLFQLMHAHSPGHARCWCSLPGLPPLFAVCKGGCGRQSHPRGWRRVVLILYMNVHEKHLKPLFKSDVPVPEPFCMMHGALSPRRYPVSSKPDESRWRGHVPVAPGVLPSSGGTAQLHDSIPSVQYPKLHWLRHSGTPLHPCTLAC